MAGAGLVPTAGVAIALVGVDTKDPMVTTAAEEAVGTATAEAVGTGTGEPDKVTVACAPLGPAC